MSIPGAGAATTSLVAEVVCACREHALLRPSDRVLVGVSGGADSTALAGLLGAARDEGLPLDLVLAHLDHGWRGPDAAAADQRVVERLAQRLNAPLVCVPPPRVVPRTEDDARRYRYRELDRVARERGIRRVAVGHHVRDQAETVLMRLLRGSGPAGLCGIPRRRPLGDGSRDVVRPLLDVDPRRLRAWLEAHDIAWEEDPTNRDCSRDRARVRERLLALEARDGSAARDLAALAERLRDRLARQESRLAARLDDEVVHHELAEAVEVPRRVLAALALGDLDLALRRLGRLIGAERDGPWLTRRHVDRIRALLTDEGAIDLPRGLHCVVSGRRVFLRRRLPDPDYALPTLRRRDVPAEVFGGALSFFELPCAQAAVDAERLGADATLRRVTAEDRFVPYGQSPTHAVPVLRWLAKRQVPRWLRARQLVVAGASGIAWVCGHRVDAGHAVLPTTTRVAILEVSCPSPLPPSRS